MKNVLTVICIAAIFCMFVSVASASQTVTDGFTGMYAKTSNMTYNTSSACQFGTNFSTPSINTFTANVTPIYTETSPYDIPFNGLVGWYKFDEGTGTLVQDFSGKGNNCTTTSMNWTDGKYNGAGIFDGNDKITTENKPVFNITTDYTVIATFKPNTVSGTQSIIEYSNIALSTERAFELRVTNGGGLYFLTGDGAHYVTTTLNSTVEPGKWYQVTVIADNNNATFYVNGVHDKTVSLSSLTQNIFEPSLMYIGAMGTANYYNGTIDNILIYNRAISENETKSIYYDDLNNLQLKTNSNTTYSDVIESGLVSVPYSDVDADINAIYAYVPSDITMEGVTVHDYSRTVSPFILSTTVECTEDITLVDETPFTNNYCMNLTFMTYSAYTSGIIKCNASLLNLDRDINSVSVLSNDTSATATYNDTQKQFTVLTGNLASQNKYDYNITVQFVTIPEFDEARHNAANTWSTSIPIVVVLVLLIFISLLLAAVRGNLSTQDLTSAVIGLMILVVVITAGYGILSSFAGLI